MAKKKLPDIGQRKARLLCQMPFTERLAFIAEGLPIIFASARGFWDASGQLKDHPREADVLQGFAKEEAAKILILMDAVRCPPKVIATKISTIARRFYEHQARLIYAQVAEWWSEDIARLRKAVEPLRKTHYLEGNMGEYILPNSTIYRRESKLYADIEAYEDGKPLWNAPSGYAGTFLFRRAPAAFRVCEAMSVLGLFSSAGVNAISDIWGQKFFTEVESLRDANQLIEQLLDRIIQEKLPTADATQAHVEMLYKHWSLPMYDVDLTSIPVTLEELKEEQERMYWAEVGEP